MNELRYEECCRPKPKPAERPLLSSREALELAAVFQVLSNDSRLRLLHALVKAGELCVSDLAETVGMTPQAVSNQLQRLQDRDIVVSRRAGNSMIYRIIDPCVISLLDQGLCLVEDTETRRLGASSSATGSPSPSLPWSRAVEEIDDDAYRGLFVSMLSPNVDSSRQNQKVSAKIEACSCRLPAEPDCVPTPRARRSKNKTSRPSRTPRRTRVHGGFSSPSPTRSKPSRAAARTGVSKTRPQPLNH